MVFDGTNNGGCVGGCETCAACELHFGVGCYACTESACTARDCAAVHVTVCVLEPDPATVVAGCKTL